VYKKHHPPFLEDEVWRLEKIGKDGAFHKRLNRESVRTVKDFLTLLHLDGPRLRKVLFWSSFVMLLCILLPMVVTVQQRYVFLPLLYVQIMQILGGGTSTKMWEATVEHAETCVLTDKVHYYYPDGVNKAGVVFNVVGEVRGLISDKFVSVDDLTEQEKVTMSLHFFIPLNKLTRFYYTSTHSDLDNLFLHTHSDLDNLFLHVCFLQAEARVAVKQAYEHWKNVFTCDNETLVENSSQLFNTRSPSLHENQYNQFPTQVSTDSFVLSHSTLQSSDIFSMEPSSSLDPCVLETEESNENRFQSEMPLVGGHEAPQESHTLDKFSNSLVYEDCSHPPFNDIYYGPVDPSISFDTQDLGAALKGFIATISKPKAAYRGWRMLSYVLGWIFYTKRIVARRKKHGK